MGGLVSRTLTERFSFRRVIRLPGLPSGGVLLSHSLLAVLCPAPTPSGSGPNAAETAPLPSGASPVPHGTVPTFHAPYAGGFLTAALPRASPLPWPSP